MHHTTLHANIILLRIKPSAAWLTHMGILCSFLVYCRSVMTGVQVIADITRRMGTGMAKYIERDVETVQDYDEYCHFVAGLVGIGLSQVVTARMCYS